MVVKGAVKDPNKVKAGKAGSAARWGPKKVIHLGEVDPGVAEVIRLMVAADEEARAKRAKEAAARSEQAHQPDAPESAA